MTTPYLLLVPVGLIAGLLGGLLGVGGSVIMIPAMYMIFGPDQHTHQAAAMIVNFFVAVPATLQHRRAGAVLWPILRGMIPLSLIGVVIGVYLGGGPWFRGSNEVYLSQCFGLFLLYVAVYNVRKLVSRKQLADIDRSMVEQIPWWKSALIVGLPTGLVGGLLGVGGGAIAVPLQQIFLRMPLRRAIANSACTIVPLSLLGASYKNLSNWRHGDPVLESIHLAVLLIPTALIGGYIGGRLTHRIPRRALRVAFILLMCYGGYKLLNRPMEAGASREPSRAETAPQARQATDRDRPTQSGTA